MSWDSSMHSSLIEESSFWSASLLDSEICLSPKLEVSFKVDSTLGALSPKI